MSVTLDEDGDYTIDGEDLEFLADVCDWLVEIMKYIPDDAPIPERVLVGLCAEARRCCREHGPLRRGEDG